MNVLSISDGEEIQKLPYQEVWVIFNILTMKFFRKKFLTSVCAGLLTLGVFTSAKADIIVIDENGEVIVWYPYDTGDENVVIFL